MIRKRSANVRGLATFCTMGILYAKYCQGFHIDHHRISIANGPIRNKFHSSTEYGNSLILNRFGQYNKDSKKLFPLRFSKSHTSSRQHKMAFNMSSSAVHGDNDGNSKSSFGIYKNPYVQVALCGVLYLFHLLVLTQHEIVFPFQLFPDNNGKFQSIGLDSVAGMASFATMIYLSRQNKDEKNNLSLDNGVPSPFSTPSKEELPWSLKKKTGGREAIAGTLLLIVYFLTGFLSELIDECLYIAKERGIGMSIAVRNENP